MLIEALIRVVEKLTDLAKYREQKRLNQFDEAVRDLYNRSPDRSHRLFKNA